MRRLVLVCLLAIAGCDRVPIGSDLEPALVVTPDLDVIQSDPDLRIRLVPESTNERLALRVGEQEVAFDSTTKAFVVEARLQRGLNTFPIALTDEADRVRTDTLYAVYLPVQQTSLTMTNASPARTDAASASLSTNQGLVTGGFGQTGEPLASATLLQLSGAQVISFELPLQRARAGHTAVPLFDGVLLLGGATAETPTGEADFVRSPEWIGPSGDSRMVQVSADGPARAGHGARVLELDGTVYLYLLGGRTPGVAAASTVDVYRVDGDGGLTFTLTRLSPTGGASGFAALAAPALASTGPRSAAAFGLGDGGVSLALRWSTPGTGAFPFSLRVRPAAPLATPRTDAVAVSVGDGLALVTGGRDAAGDPVGRFEVYAAEADRVFRFPGTIQMLVPRSGHTATIFSGGRIVIGGGRPASGRAIVSYEALQL